MTDREPLSAAALRFLAVFDSVVQDENDGTYRLHTDADLHNAASDLRTALKIAERVEQADWFIREVKRCAAIGMPLGCCDEWPECSHVLEWIETRKVAGLSD